MGHNTKIICIYIIIIFTQVIASNSNDYVKFKSIEVASDLPTHKDLPGYLTSLERIINFYSHNRNLDLNLVFGLFLINVNIRSFVKYETLPVPLRRRLNNLLMKNDEIQDYYSFKILKNHSPDRMIYSLFTNETAWSERIFKLNLDLLKDTYSYSYQHPKWSRYLRAVDDIDKWIPTPHQSDVCMASLSESEENLSKYPLRCEIPADCYNTLIFGTNFGYGLTHRLVLLLHARLSRACAIFSIDEDALLRNTFCETAYREAEYNALKGFKIIDLMFEQMALCTLDGHAQFLRKSWISSLLQFQHPSGCFSETLPIPNANGLSDSDGKCNGHVSAVAAGTLAAAVRLILENY